MIRLIIGIVIGAVMTFVAGVGYIVWKFKDVYR